MAEEGACRHLVTRGRDDQPSGRSWCIECGALALDFHDRPCGECKHYGNGLAYGYMSDRVGLCRRQRMTVARDMLVTFTAFPGGCSPLCFEARQSSETDPQREAVVTPPGMAL